MCVNLLRHPAWGRAQETYGEDSYHVGEMGAALAEGIRVVVRGASDCEVRAYDYRDAANQEWRVNELLNNRVAGHLDGHEVAVVAGDGQRPDDGTLLKTLRESYWQ